MNKSVVAIAIALYILAMIPVAIYWGMTPYFWLDRNVEATLEQTHKEFPIHFAPLPPSPIRQHAALIETEDEKAAQAFDPRDWAFREMRYRLMLLFLIWSVAGTAVHWFASELIREKRNMRR